jgi:hypothetical protein
MAEEKRPAARGRQAFKFNREIEEKFIEALKDKNSVGDAARAAKVSLVTLYKQKRKSPKFAEEWDDALRGRIVLAIDELWKRAVHGTKRRVYWRDQYLHDETVVHNDCLFKFLQAECPEKFDPVTKVRMDVTSSDGTMIPRVVQASDSAHMLEIREMFKQIADKEYHCGEMKKGYEKRRGAKRLKP